jgi:phosphatidylserine/phosphatidylglycerophosphate/cardiolipin synthase-like enzyme
VTLMVEGAVAGALGDLFRERWREAGEKETDQARGTAAVAAAAPWPRAVEPQFQNLPVAIARTKAVPGQPVAQEILNLTLASIRAARRTIYLENQYFTSRLVAEGLAERLMEPAGPQIVLILGDQSPSWFDRFTMDYARVPIIRRLQALDTHGRLRVYTARTARGGPIRVHSKVSIFDDAIVRIGSANLNHRSGGFDSECELAIEASTADQRRTIRSLRDRLISHFLGVTQDAFTRAAREVGLGEAIDALNNAGRLAPLRPRVQGPWEAFVSRYRVGDPTSIDDSWQLLRRRVQAPQRPQAPTV